MRPCYDLSPDWANFLGEVCAHEERRSPSEFAHVMKRALQKRAPCVPCGFLLGTCVCANAPSPHEKSPQRERAPRRKLCSNDGRLR
jgi:hypothetical protein